MLSELFWHSYWFESKSAWLQNGVFEVCSSEGWVYEEDDLKVKYDLKMKKIEGREL